MRDAYHGPKQQSPADSVCQFSRTQCKMAVTSSGWFFFVLFWVFFVWVFLVFCFLFFFTNSSFGNISSYIILSMWVLNSQKPWQLFLNKVPTSAQTSLNPKADSRSPHCPDCFLTACILTSFAHH